MKKELFLLIMMPFFSCSGGISEIYDAKTEAAVYTEGEAGPAGGIVFYVNPSAASDGWTYIEAAPDDETGTLSWDDASTVCGTKTTGSYTDWFLPSLSDLRIMRTKMSLIGLNSSLLYWTSSQEGTSNLYYYIKISTGEEISNNPSVPHSVRAIRRF